jgi:hypothetical protein
MVLTNIPKGIAYKLVLQANFGFSGNTPYRVVPYQSSQVTDASSKVISKDDGGFVALTNAPQYVSLGLLSVDLTATEMNADKIIVSVAHGTSVSNDATVSFTAVATIFTGSSSGSGISAADVWGYETRSLTSAPASAGVESQYVSEDIVRKASHRHYFEAIGLATITKAKISLDGNAFVASTHNPVAISGIAGCYYVDLDSHETNCFGLMIVAQDASDNAVYSAVLRPKIYNSKQGYRPVYAA